MAKEGRPSEFKPEYCEQARKLTDKGFIDKELADFFEVSEQTINAWKKAYPEFLEAIKQGKELADHRVERSLYERANGYSHPEDKIFCDTKTGAITVQPTIKHYPPDTVACIFWLKNRKKDVWRDKLDHELSGPNGGPIEYKIIPRDPNKGKNEGN